METWTLSLLLLSLHGAAAVIHSLKYFDTASSGLPNFPEFVAVGLFDELQIVHYDSKTKRAEPKQDWMIRVREDDPENWKSLTELFLSNQQVSKVNIGEAKQHFNQSGGVHIYQRMGGCEWEDETNEVVRGFYQHGFDGEDFISFDMNTGTWIAPKQQAVSTKHKLDQNKALTAQINHYLTQICPEWLKNCVKYGSSSLMRTELPLVSLLQKSPSSPVCCHATGFYPDRASLFWRKDGEELHEDVDHGEILHNHDGTFQISVDLKLSSVPAEDWRRYECVFQLSGVEKNIVTRLDEAVIRTNAEKPNDMTTTTTTTTTIIIIIAAVVVLVLAVGGFMAYKKWKDKDPQKNVKTPLNPSPPPMSQSGSDSLTEGVNSSTRLM
ncbi:major histocompatibility complex class I-related gene protein-like isoform X1 [Clinocottus analis]|uniref:major histocompatibility complex class I-related gene protein-like isoform X1 n=1 Tax=Clinocottus analis TaxID=304258 RepID=UPI0035C0B5C8